MKMINDQGGINGRKINLISVDDGFMPWRTGNETRKLIEVEQVAFVFGSIGTTTQLSVAKYLNERKIPQLFIESGAYRWGHYKDTPYTIGGVRPSYRLGARLYARHTLKQKPNAKICILYEDNDWGRDYTDGVRDVLGDKYAATVREATYEFTDASIDRQVVELKATGCDALIAATVLQFAEQTIRKVHDLGWKPIFFMNNISASVPIILEPAGLESSIGLLSSAYGKDPRDPAFENDPAMADWRAWMRKYLPDADVRRAELRQRLQLRGHHGAGAQTGRQRSLAREYHAPGDEPARTRAPDAAAGNQGQHQSDRLLCGPAVAADAV